MKIAAQERYSWIQLAVCVTVILSYSIKVFGNDALGTHELDVLIIQTTIFASVACALGAIVNRYILKESKVEKDEMDVLIESKAYRNAYFTAIGIAWWAIASILIVMGIESALMETEMDVQETMAIIEQIPGVIHTLFLGMFLTYSVFCGTQIFYYRKGGVQ